MPIIIKDSRKAIQNIFSIKLSVPINILCWPFRQIIKYYNIKSEPVIIIKFVFKFDIDTDNSS